MKQLSKYIATAVIGIFLGLMIFKALDCSSKTPQQILNENRALNESINILEDSVSASNARAQMYYDSMMIYKNQKPVIKEYYKYVYQQVDSIVDRDSNDVYRLIRAYTDSILSAQ